MRRLLARFFGVRREEEVENCTSPVVVHPKSLKALAAFDLAKSMCTLHQLPASAAPNMNLASRLGRIDILEWWLVHSPDKPKYCARAMDKAANPEVLQWWKDHRHVFPLLYTSCAMDRPRSVEILDWWQKSELPQKYTVRRFDVKDRDCLKWWAARGRDSVKAEERLAALKRHLRWRAYDSIRLCLDTESVYPITECEGRIDDATDMKIAKFLVSLKDLRLIKFCKHRTYLSSNYVTAVALDPSENLVDWVFDHANYHGFGALTDEEILQDIFETASRYQNIRALNWWKAYYLRTGGWKPLDAPKAIAEATMGGKRKSLTWWLQCGLPLCSDIPLSARDWWMKHGVEMANLYEKRQSNTSEFIKL